MNIWHVVEDDGVSEGFAFETFEVEECPKSYKVLAGGELAPEFWETFEHFGRRGALYVSKADWKGEPQKLAFTKAQALCLAIEEMTIECLGLKSYLEPLEDYIGKLYLALVEEVNDA